MIEQILQKAIDEEIIPGAVFVRAIQGEIVDKIVIGNAALRPDIRQMYEDTLFDCASLTKPVVTATLTMKLHDRKQINIYKPVCQYLPEFDRGGITPFHLLTHSSGLPSWQPLYLNIKDQQDIGKYLAGSDMGAEPGRKIAYSCLGYILLGNVLERITGKKLDEIAQEEIFEPFKMEKACFNPGKDIWRECAATENDNFFERRETGYADHQWREGTICGEVHDENAHWLGGVSGNAGLFATASDLMAWARIFVDETAGFLSKESYDLTTRVQAHIGETRRSCGFAVLPNDTIYHTGFTGTALRIDYLKKETVIFLSNAIHCGSYIEAINPLREKVFKAIDNIN